MSNWHRVAPALKFALWAALRRAKIDPHP